MRDATKKIEEIPINLGLNLSITEKQLLADFHFSNALLIEKKRRTAKRLRTLYRNGYRERSDSSMLKPERRVKPRATESLLCKKTAELAIPDKAKARKYAKLAGYAIKESTHGTGIFTTATTYDVLGWFTASRLFSIRLDRLLKIFHTSILPAFMKFGGLSYGIELLFDCSIIFKNTFLDPIRAHEKDLPFLKRIWQRFTLSLMKDDRPLRMLNAALWLSVNLTCLFLTGGAYWGVLLTGFSGDVGMAVINGIKETWKSAVLLHKVKASLNNRTQEILRLENLFEKTPSEQNKLALDKAIEERDALLELRAQLRKKIAWTVISNTFKVALTVGVLVAMILLATNPVTAVPTAIAIASVSVAFIAGSLLSGLGKKVLSNVGGALWESAKGLWYCFRPVITPKIKRARIISHAKQSDIAIREEAQEAPDSPPMRIPSSSRFITTQLAESFPIRQQISIPETTAKSLPNPLPSPWGDENKPAANENLGNTQHETYTQFSIYAPTPTCRPPSDENHRTPVLLAQ